MLRKTPRRLRGHSIVAAACTGQPDVLFCASCGANAQYQRRGRGKLLTCQGPEALGLAEARRRLMQGLHPHPSKKRMKIDPARGLSLAARAAWRAVLDPAQIEEESAKYSLEWQPLPVETVAGLHGFHSAQAAVAWERRKAQQEEEERRREAPAQSEAEF